MICEIRGRKFLEDSILVGPIGQVQRLNSIDWISVNLLNPPVVLAES